MTITVECACGSTLAIDDASELAGADILRLWHEYHADHRKGESE
jgi:hypothetical protein